MTKPTLRTRWQPQLPVPLPEYPRPQFQRRRWLNLNGFWEYAINSSAEVPPPHMQGNILVPFPLESQLSTVQTALQPGQTLWLQRSFNLPPDWQDEMVKLHFGAVDHTCQVWLNGQLLGGHIGGYTPFSFDIGSALQPGENTLLLAVQDATDSGTQQRGKQVLHPKGIWYTAVSGIWQTVWLEPLPALQIAGIHLLPDIENECLLVEIDNHQQLAGCMLELSTTHQSREIKCSFPANQQRLRLDLAEPHLWSPADPHLYPLHLKLTRDGKTLDEVESYFGMRQFSLLPDDQGRQRFSLNGKKLFLYGPLDQGYYPDGLYTPASEEAMLYDLQYLKAIGCNMVRKHVKTEPARWYAACDRLGLIVWQDMPNGGRYQGDVLAFLATTLNVRRRDDRRLGRYGRKDAASQQQFLDEMEELVKWLRNVPSLAVWVPFNEGWGQFYSHKIARLVKQWDPTRLVDAASGWFDQDGGDFISRHIYFRSLPDIQPDTQRAAVVSEFGGYSLTLPGHVWNDKLKFGYRFFKTSAELTKAYLNLLEKELKPLLKNGLSAAMYTQTSDVEVEVNGYLTYDRALEKMERQALREAHLELIRLGSE